MICSALRGNRLNKGDPVALPLTQNSMFHLPGNPESDLPYYGRVQNPTWDAVEKQLSHLEAQYQSALAQVGLGHEGAREQEEYVRWKKKREAEQERAAKTRGKAALQAELQKEKMKQQVL